MAQPDKEKFKFYCYFLPIVGGMVFCALFLAAAHAYPGGSNADNQAVGFNWYANYWCDLLGATAKNGRENKGQPLALSAMLVLCAALACFWLVVPDLFNSTPGLKKSIRIAGFISAFSSFFIFTNWHDSIINLSSLAGVWAALLLLRGLFLAKYRVFFYTGLGIIAVVLANLFIYYSKVGLAYLPIIQKVSFMYVLVWVMAICVVLIKNARQMP